MDQRRVNRANTSPSATEADRQHHWSGSAIIDALRTAAAHFEPHVQAINALNVFPVPDGDTGTNMFLTIQAAVQEIQKLNHGQRPHAGTVLAGAAHGALMGARGNSGVILYQILAGLAESCQGAHELDGPCLASGLRRASELAYRAVVNPVEGTMLTVIRAAAEAAEAASRRESSLTSVLAAALAAAERAVSRTPEMLDILRQAGVVDAGGQGLAVLLRGLQRYVQGATLELGPSAALEAASLAAAMPFLDQLDTLHGTDEFGYCTNFLVTGRSIAVDAFRERMNGLGTSVVVVGDQRTVKVHIHSDHPGTVLEAALEFGELLDVRIDNMSAQTQRLREARAESTRPGAALPAGEEAAIAVVAVASGAGVTDALRGMGAAAVVAGGPTFNPSTEDILRAVESLPQQHVIILPNDPNVIPTARQVDRLTERVVRVVPSRSIPEGISALSAFNFDASLDENVVAMSEAIGLVRSIALTRATRDARIGEIDVRTGQFIGLLAGELRAAGDDPVAVVLDVLALAAPEDAELVTLFVGEPAPGDLAGRLAEAINEAYPDLTVEVAPGGQPHYDLIVSVE